MTQPYTMSHTLSEIALGNDRKPFVFLILDTIYNVANSLKSAHSPAGDLPGKSGSPDQMLIALTDIEWSFCVEIARKNGKKKLILLMCLIDHFHCKFIGYRALWDE